MFFTAVAVLCLSLLSGILYGALFLHQQEGALSLKGQHSLVLLSVRSMLTRLVILGAGMLLVLQLNTPLRILFFITFIIGLWGRVLFAWQTDAKN